MECNRWNTLSLQCFHWQDKRYFPKPTFHLFPRFTHKVGPSYSHLSVLFRTTDPFIYFSLFNLFPSGQTGPSLQISPSAWSIIKLCFYKSHTLHTYTLSSCISCLDRPCRAFLWSTLGCVRGARCLWMLSAAMPAWRRWIWAGTVWRTQERGCSAKLYWSTPRSGTRCCKWRFME